jgi:VWFA-related protein
MISTQRLLALICAVLMLPATPHAQQQQTPPPPPPPPTQYRIHATTELVLVNVVARDKKGNLVKDLKKEDFTLLEDGKKQDILSFDFENTDQVLTAGGADKTVSGEASQPAVLKSTDRNAPIDARDRRLILLFFDFSAMDPEQIDRGVEAAKKFVQTKMQPADLIASVSLSTNLNTDLDFTDDKAKVLATLNSYGSSQGQGFDNGNTGGTADGSAETSGSFTADDTDYNTFSADRKLLALQSVMEKLGKIQQKKSIIYFSNGISQNGVDNQSALRATTSTAVKNNVSIYPLDVNGLQAFPPGGQAQNASLHGQSAYNGQAVYNDLNSNANNQETMSTLAADTGGKAFFDDNDFSGVFSQVEKDTSAYYVLGFTSTNPAKDGRYRHIKVQVNRSDLKLEFRQGYYAGRDFEHLNRTDREQQLQDEMMAELSDTDVAVYAGAAYFRQDDSHYYLAVSLAIPGSQIPFVSAKDKDNATIDIVGQVRLAGSKFPIPVGQLRDTVKLAVDTAQQVRRKNVQYNTGFVLAPGSYHLKFIVRENQTGRIGTFETDVQIPDLRKTPLRMSSVILSSQRVPATDKKKGSTPLVRDQTETVPNITHVFTQDQHLYLQYEIYDAARGKVADAAPTQAAASGVTPSGAAAAAPAAAQAPAPKTHEGVRVLTSIEFLQGSSKVFESKPIVANEVNAPERKAVLFQIDLPLLALKPGFYTCQVNVLDDVSGNFAFPRWPILVKEAAPPAAAKPAASGK